MSEAGTTAPAKIRTSTNTKQVRIARPRSAEIPARPSLAITEVTPAKSIEMNAYPTHLFIAWLAAITPNEWRRLGKAG
jgi:hypothetical protein